MNSHAVAFVAGATGYTGRAVVARLAALGIETHAHVRPDSPRLEQARQSFGPLGVHVDDTPWTEAAFVARFAQLRPTLVFGLLGVTLSGAKREAKERGEDAATWESVDYALTVVLARAAAAVEPMPRFIYLSSLGSGPNTANGYLKVRWRTECAIRELGVPFTIARPSFITGEGREGRALEKFGGQAANVLTGALGAFGAKRAARRFRSRTNTELADALVRLARDPDAEGKVFESEQF